MDTLYYFDDTIKSENSVELFPPITLESIKEV